MVRPTVPVALAWLELGTSRKIPAERHDPNRWSLSGCEETAGYTSSRSPDTEILEIWTSSRTGRLASEIAPDD